MADTAVEKGTTPTKEEKLEAARKRFEALKKKQKKKKKSISKAGSEKEAEESPAPEKVEDSEETKAEAKDEEDKESSAKTTECKEQEKSASADGESKEQPLEDILSSDTPAESGFLTSSLQEEVASLRSKIDEQMVEIKKLKEENSALKVAKVTAVLELEEVKNDYETAKEQIKALNQQVEKLKIDAAQRDVSPSSPLFSDDDHNLLGTSAAVNNYYDLPSGGDTEAARVKEKMSQWKGWNIDMRGWRSLGMGPLFEM